MEEEKFRFKMKIRELPPRAPTSDPLDDADISFSDSDKDVFAMANRIQRSQELPRAHFIMMCGV